MEVEIGRGKKARRAYGFDDIAIVPSRRTRDPDDVDISWKLGDYRFELPQLVLKYYELALDAGLDILVIQGTVVSAEHVSETSEPLNLKEFIASLDVPVVAGGCASYHTGLHLMRTGAAGGVVGGRPGRPRAPPRGVGGGG